jgi:hypothetical protein
MVISTERRNNIAHLMAPTKRSDEPALEMTQPPSNSVVLALSGSSLAARVAKSDARDPELDKQYGKYRKGVVPVSARAPSPPSLRRSVAPLPHARKRSRSRSPSRPSVLERMPDPGFGGPGTQWAPGIHQYLPERMPAPNRDDRVFVTMLNGRTMELKNASANDAMDDVLGKLREAAGFSREELDDIMLVQLFQGPEVAGTNILELIMLPVDAVLLQPGSVRLLVDASDSGWLDFSGKKGWDKHLAFHVWASHKISTLKDMCMSKTGEPVDNLCFKFEGKQLNDANTLAECNIHTGCILHLVRAEGRQVVVETFDGQDVTLFVNHGLVSNLETIDFGICGHWRMQGSISQRPAYHILQNTIRQSNCFWPMFSNKIATGISHVSQQAHRLVRMMTLITSKISFKW